MGPPRRLDRSLTAEQVADELGGLMSAHSLRRLARAGRIPGAFRLGGRYFFAGNTAAWLTTDLSAVGGAGLMIRAPKEGTDSNGTTHFST
jgi:hypothetical protein